MVGCPTCGAELTYIEPYGRHYCYGCRSYAPRTLHPCETCGRALVFVEQSQRFYCYGCQAYQEDPGVRNPCPGCGNEMEYLPQYERFYCFACQRYAPRAYGLTGRSRRTRRMTEEGETQDEALGYAPFSREELDLASKEQLIAWCRDYGLDATGMKYELRLRLLEHIRKQGLLLRGEEPVEAEAGPPPEEPEEPAEPADETPEAPPAVVDAHGSEEVVRDEEEAVPAEEAPQKTSTVSGGPVTHAHPPSRQREGTCANCGSELTYIPQYGRWYCYGCRTYAPADRPGPAGHGVPRAAQGSRAVKFRHQGTGSPLVGIYLALTGVVLFVAEMLLFRAPGVFDLPVLTTAAEVEFALEFLSIVFIALGLVASLLVVRAHG